MKTVAKTVCREKNSFLPPFIDFLNDEPLRSEIGEDQILLKHIPSNRIKKKTTQKYEIRGKKQGKLGIIKFNLLPSSILPQNKLKSNSRTYWIIEVCLINNIPKPFVFAVEYFLQTYTINY